MLPVIILKNMSRIKINMDANIKSWVIWKMGLTLYYRVYGISILHKL